MKLNFIYFLFLTLTSASLYANTTRVQKINEELAKIASYRDKGNKNSELDKQEQELLKERTNLTKDIKKDKIVKKQTSSTSTYKKFRPQDYLTFIHKIENATERLVVITSKLKEERGALAMELNNEKRDDLKISELRDKIDILEWEKNKIETSLAKSTLTNDLVKFKTGGIFDFYYGHSSNGGGNSGNTGDITDGFNSFRYYDNQHNEFVVNLVELSFSAVLNGTSFFLELDFGEFAEQNAPGDEVTKHIGQAFLTHDLDSSHSVAAGKMYTHVGFELAKPIDNWNYSRSYTFAFAGPFWHEGIALKGSYSNGMRLGLFAYDATDTRRDSNSEKSLGAQLGWANDYLTVIYNFIGGPEGTSNGKKRIVHELNAQYNYRNGVSLALDTVYGRDDEASINGRDYEWRGIVGYVNYQMSDLWRISLRSEIFQETTGSKADSFKLSPATRGTEIYSQTFTFAKTLSERNELRLEFRHDNSTEDIYYNRYGNIRSNQDTATLAWVVGI